MGKFIITDNGKRFVSANREVMDGAMETMSKDISTMAKSRVPFKSSDLFKAINPYKVKQLHHQVIADTEYAAYQEEGQRKDGTHVVKKYTTPSTGKDFLKGAGDKVTSNALNYLKQAVHSIKL